MSHTTEMTTSYLTKNEAELVASLKEVFGEDGVEVHDDLAQLYLFNGSTSNSHYGEAGRAHIVIRKATLSKVAGRPLAVNDLGFVRKEDGTYQMLVDGPGFPQTARDKVAQDYSTRVTAKQLKKQGYMVKISRNLDGSTKVHASRYA